MKKAALLFLIAMIALSCDNSTQDRVELEQEMLFNFREHIAQVSEDIISTRDELKIVLTEPVEQWTPGQELADDLIKIKPHVDGKAVVASNLQISFIPSKPLKGNTEYQIDFNIGKVKEVPENLQVFTFFVKTIKQDFIVKTSPISSYSRDYQYINGSVITSDFIEFENINKLVKATLDGKSPKIKFTEVTALSKRFDFVIDSIIRPVETQELKLLWNGTDLGIETKGSNTISIPGKDSFSVTGITLVNEENQYVEISFSDPLLLGQNLNGLVQITGSNLNRYEINSNIINVYPENTIRGSNTITVFEGIKSIDNYSLKKEFTTQIAFEQTDPQLKLLQSGTIMPSSNNLKLNFQAVNLKAVDVWVYKVYADNVLQFLQGNNLNGSSNLRNVARPVARKVIDLKGTYNYDLTKWNAFAIDLSTIIEADRGAIYRVEFKYKKAYSLYNCSDSPLNEEEVEEVVNFDDSIAENSNWDNYQNYYYDDYGYDYNWSERENPCSNSFYRNKNLSTNILASDLGITVKKGENNQYFVAVNSLLNTKPLAGAVVTLFNLQQQEIFSRRTNTDGIVSLDLDSSAFFAMVTYNDEVGYVRLDDGESLSTSKFNTSGVQLKKGIKGYIYGERGVWRPGDNIFLNFVLNDTESPLPVNHPVTLELRDPNGKLVSRDVQNVGVNNVYAYKLQTSKDAPTGNWSALVEVGGVNFTERIRIETIKPNRLKVLLNFDKKVLSKSESTQGTLETRWLHGATAKGLKAEISAKVLPAPTAFDQFEAYTFDDPSRNFSTEEINVFSGTVNNQGKATFNFSSNSNSPSAGMLKASFLTKVYENGGDFSTDVTTVPYSPYETYVGVLSPPGDKSRGMLLTDTDHKFSVATVDKDGSPKSVKQLDVKVYKLNWRWWWESSSNNLSRYNSDTFKELVYSTTASTPASGKSHFNIHVKYPEWGRYLVRVEDPESGHATGSVIYMDWPGWAGKSRKTDPDAASILVLTADKENYTSTEQASISFPSSKGGRALVSIENGTKVLHSFWVETQEKQTQFKVPLQDKYVPNVYVHVSYIQRHSQTLNDLPIRMYGIIPLMVENKNTHLEPVISMPDELAPESQFTLTVSEKNSQAMTYTIAVVDEGLLDLTNFATPNPWDDFYAKEALGVKTWDIYDDVMGAYGGQIDQIFSIGGDGIAAGAKAKKANRFKPMVVHLGPFKLAAGASKKHQIDIPKYVGSVRTMVVASNHKKESYGNAEKTTPVKKPLMLLGSLPRKLSPGESFKLPISVFAMDSKIKNVTVFMKSSPYFEFLDDATQNLNFTEVGDQIAYIHVKVKNKTGIAQVQLTAKSGSESASFETEIDVVNPNPYTTQVTRETVEPGKTITIPIDRFGSEGTNTAMVNISSLPDMNLGRRLAYLIRYPHGCAEQTTSAAFAQLYMTKMSDITVTQQSEIERNIKIAIRKLDNYQLSNGGFSYWPGQQNVNDWSSSYVGHFMIEAEQLGYSLPISFKSNWIAYQQRAAKQWRNDNNDLNQAYRLYTLALAGSPDLSSMNRLRELSTMSNEGKLRLAAAYALVGKQSVAKKMVQSSNIDFESKKNDYKTYGSPIRNRAMALETYILLGDKVQARAMTETIIKSLQQDRFYATQSTAYSVIAIGKYINYASTDGVKLDLNINGTSEKIASSKPIVSRKIQSGDNVNLTNTSANTLFVDVAVTGKLPVGSEKVLQKNLKATVQYTDIQNKPIQITKLNQSTEIIATLSLTNSSALKVRDIALTQIIPSGWEIINTRYTDYNTASTPDNADYIDIRDDRVNYYFDLDKNATKTFKIRINASYLGDYYLPGVQAEAMYDQDYIVRTKGTWISIIK